MFATGNESIINMAQVKKVLLFSSSEVTARRLGSLYNVPAISDPRGDELAGATVYVLNDRDQMIAARVAAEVFNLEADIDHLSDSDAATILAEKGRLVHQRKVSEKNSQNEHRAPPKEERDGNQRNKVLHYDDKPA